MKPSRSDRELETPDTVVVDLSPGQGKATSFRPNFDPENPDCMTLVLMGEHLDPTELADITDSGYSNMLLLVTAAGAIVNIVLSVAKILAGYIYHSKALLADGVHSLSDLISDIVAAWAGYLAGRPADDKHPYGYGKYEALGALWVAFMLLMTAASLIYHMYDHFLASLAGNIPYVELPAMFVAIISTVLKEVTFQGTFRVGERLKSQVLIANAWHHRSDALSSIAALAGVVGANAGFLWMDAVAGVVVSMFMVKVGVEMAFEAVGSLADKGVTEEVQEDVESVFAELIEGKQFQGALKRVRARHLGRKMHIDITVAFPSSLSVGATHRSTEVLRTSIKKKIPNTGEVFIQIDSEA